MAHNETWYETLHAGFGQYFTVDKELYREKTAHQDLIIFENAAMGRRIVIDTKFTSIFTYSAYREQVLKSQFIYQMYAYLRSQAGTGSPLCDKAEGILLHPAIDANVDETVHIQGHPIRFVTVDLAQTTTHVLDTLRSLVRSSQTTALS